MSAMKPAVVRAVAGGSRIPFRPHRKGRYPLFNPAPRSARCGASDPLPEPDPKRAARASIPWSPADDPDPPFHARASIGMPEQSDQNRTSATPPTNPFDVLVNHAGAPAGGGFTTAFRGYDRDEVDATISKLTSQLQARADEAAGLEDRFRRAAQAAVQQNRRTVERLEADLAAANAKNRETAKRLADEQAAGAAAREAAEKLKSELDAATADEALERLTAELTAATARAGAAEQKVQMLTDELVGAAGAGDSTNRHQFEEILRVAEEQASTLIRNASVQGDRLLEAAREEIAARRKEVQVEAEAILQQAQHDAQQIRLRVETELTAHQAQLEREAAHAAEKVSQAEQEAAAIRSEAEKGAAALRSMVSRETTRDRAEAEQAVRELRMRALEFEESLTRRQDDAQQEFLVLHNQAVAHAERITQDANEQVAASLEHAQRVSAKADDFEKLMRAQAQQIEADARIRARETLDRARDKAQHIIETVTAHSQAVLRDAEDRTRQLRWQQHQLTSFMAEVTELIRPEGVLDSVPTEEEAVVQQAEDIIAAEHGEHEHGAHEHAGEADAESSGDEAAGDEADEAEELEAAH
ncbi:hypothetical protein GCM10023087_06790 [Microbacterium rhizosphaerae]